MTDAEREVPGAADTPEQAEQVEQAEQAAAEHRRRVDRVFGAVLADTTEDERGPGDDERGAGTHDDWLRSNVPPHHG